MVMISRVCTEHQALIRSLLERDVAKRMDSRKALDDLWVTALVRRKSKLGAQHVAMFAVLPPGHNLTHVFFPPRLELCFRVAVECSLLWNDSQSISEASSHGRLSSLCVFHRGRMGV